MEKCVEIWSPYTVHQRRKFFEGNYGRCEHQPELYSYGKNLYKEGGTEGQGEETKN